MKTLNLTDLEKSKIDLNKMGELIDVTELCNKYVNNAITTRFPKELEEELDKFSQNYFLYKGNIVRYTFDDESTYFIEVIQLDF